MTRLGDCWVWTGYIGTKGYGQFHIMLNGRKAKRDAHRVSFAIFHGEIPEGMTVDHTCRNTRCVNPAHLRLLTHAENTALGNTNRKEPVNAEPPAPF